MIGSTRLKALLIAGVLALVGAIGGVAGAAAAPSSSTSTQTTTTQTKSSEGGSSSKGSGSTAGPKAMGGHKCPQMGSGGSAESSTPEGHSGAFYQAGRPGGAVATY